MSFWKTFFGGGAVGSDPAVAKVVSQIEYNGYVIAARPYLEDGQFQAAGTIAKDIGGQRLEHRFVRADRLATAADAADVMITKAKQFIDQQGDKIFG